MKGDTASHGGLRKPKHTITTFKFLEEEHPYGQCDSVPRTVLEYRAKWQDLLIVSSYTIEQNHLIGEGQQTAKRAEIITINYSQCLLDAITLKGKPEKLHRKHRLDREPKWHRKERIVHVVFHT